jgi:hypothetical protein
MPKRANGGDIQFWQCKIDEQTRSGLPASEFCRTQWLSLAAFYNWRRKFSAAGTELCHSASVADSAFVEFTIGGAS